jgi:hypothetical protein
MHRPSQRPAGVTEVKNSRQLQVVEDPYLNCTPSPSGTGHVMATARASLSLSWLFPSLVGTAVLLYPSAGVEGILCGGLCCS